MVLLPLPLLLTGTSASTVDKLCAIATTKHILVLFFKRLWMGLND